MLKVRDLRVKLGGKIVVDGASFDVGSGVTMLLGRNGCGKSTLIRAMLGLIVSKGELIFEGCDLRKLNARKRAAVMAYLPQKQTVPPGTIALDYVAMGAGGLFSPPDVAAQMRTMAEIARLGLETLAQRHVGTLSGGELRLMGLARARTQNARLMVMDEPLAGLDFYRQHEFLRETKRDGRPVFMSIHDPMLAWQYADRILVMDGGKIFAPEDEAAFQQHLTRIFGAELHFEQVGGMRLPIWHE